MLCLSYRQSLCVNFSDGMKGEGVEESLSSSTALEVEMLDLPTKEEPHQLT